MARNRYDQDEILEDRFDINQLKRLRNYIRPYKGKMLLVLFLMLSSSALQMFIPKFFQLEMDEYIPAEDMRGIVTVTILAALIILYSVICTRVVYYKKMKLPTNSIVY
ncbi:MAG: ABC transporter ATP-binding protein, partial [Lachnospiraceae bacterium]|nr:ABC transporter ATP-binding protein [Lachnospiraceae bacterium]